MVSRGDHNAIYTESMIRLALDKAGFDYRLDIDSGGLSWARQVRDTQEGRIDIMWSATSREIEQQLIPVRVPLFKGLVGHRLFVVHNDNRDLFSGVVSLNDLKQFTYGQGVGWPDAQILGNNGFKVREESFDRLRMMVQGKRFQVFPRGVHEPWTELESWPELELTVEPHILLVYRMPFYLFVSPKKPELAEALQKGLMVAVEDGSFDELFYRSAMIQRVIQRANIAERRVFYLDNRDLSPETPVDDSRLWLTLEQLCAPDVRRASLPDSSPCR